MTLPLALSGDQWLALAGVLSGVLVGGVGLVFAYFNGKSERAYGERLARSGRLHEQRLAAYKEIARLLQRQRLYLVRTEPIIGPKPDPPQRSADLPPCPLHRMSSRPWRKPRGRRATSRLPS